MRFLTLTISCALACGCSYQPADQQNSSPDPLAAAIDGPSNSDNAFAKNGAEPQTLKPGTDAPPAPPTVVPALVSQTAKPASPVVDPQLHKNVTLLVLVYPPDLRADFLIKNLRRWMNEEQIKRALAIALTYEDRYLELRDRRAAILEHANDESDVAGQLLAVRQAIADLNLEARNRINREILTTEQRKAMQEHYKKL